MAKQSQSGRSRPHRNRAPGRLGHANPADSAQAAALADRIAAAATAERTHEAAAALSGVPPELVAAAVTLLIGRDAAGRAAVGSLIAQAPEHVAIVAITTIERQRDAEAVAFLADLAPTMPRALAKLCRRALAHLAAAGLDVPAAPPPPPIFSPAATGIVEQHGLLTGFDPMGNQAVFLAFTHVPVGSFMATAVAHEQLGLQHFHATRYTRTELDRQLRRWQQGEGATVAIPVGYDLASAIFQQAVDRARTHDRSLPEAYESWTEVAPAAGELPSVAPAYAALEIEPEMLHLSPLDDGGELLDEPDLTGWTIPYQPLQGHALHMHEAETSQIVLSPEAQERRERAIIAAAAEEVFTATTRKRFRHRLETAALVFARTGREPLARRALAAAEALTDNERPLIVQPFAMELVERALRVAMEAQVPQTAAGRELLGQVLHESEAAPEPVDTADI